MFDLEYYQPNGSLKPAKSDVIFNNSTAIISGLSIDKSGMYLLNIELSPDTTGSSIKFSDCLSKPIEVRKSNAVFTTDFSAKPNFVLKFDDVTETLNVVQSYVRDILISNVYNLMNKYSVNAAGLAVYEGILVTFWSADDSNDLRNILSNPNGIDIGVNKGGMNISLKYINSEINGDYFGNQTEKLIEPTFMSKITSSTTKSSRSPSSTSKPSRSSSTTSKSSRSPSTTTKSSRSPSSTSKSSRSPSTTSKSSRSPSTTFESSRSPSSTTETATVTTKKTCKKEKHKHRHHKKCRRENDIVSLFRSINFKNHGLF